MQAEQTLKQEPDMPATDENAEAGTAGGRLVLVKRLAPVAVILAGLAFGYLKGWHRYLSLDMLVESRDMLSAFVVILKPFKEFYTRNFHRMR